MPSDLVCIPMQAKARRKLDRGGQAAGSVAAPKSRSQRQQGRGGRDLLMEGASSSESRHVGAGRGEGFLAPRLSDSRERVRRQRRDRKRRWPHRSVTARDKTPAQWLTPPHTKGGGSPPSVAGESDPGHHWCGDTKSLHHAGSKMPSGYSMPPRRALFRSHHKRGAQGPVSKEAVSEVRVSCS